MVLLSKEAFKKWKLRKFWLFWEENIREILKRNYTLSKVFIWMGRLDIEVCLETYIVPGDLLSNSCKMSLHPQHHFCQALLMAMDCSDGAKDSYSLCWWPKESDTWMWYASKCLITVWNKIKMWFIVCTHFLGTNTLIMADFKLHHITSPNRVETSST